MGRALLRGISQSPWWKHWVSSGNLSSGFARSVEDTSSAALTWVWEEEGRMGIWAGVCAQFGNILLISHFSLLISWLWAQSPPWGLTLCGGRVHPTISVPCKEGDTAPLLSAHSYPLSVLQRFVEWVTILLLLVTVLPVTWATGSFLYLCAFPQRAFGGIWGRSVAMVCILNQKYYRDYLIPTYNLAQQVCHFYFTGKDTGGSVWLSTNLKVT